MSEVPEPESLAGASRPAVALCRLRPPDVGHGRHPLPGHAHALDDLVSGDVVGHHPEVGDERRQAVAIGPRPFKELVKADHNR